MVKNKDVLQFFFLGVTTEKSLVRQLFQAWCSVLNISNCTLHGINKPPYCALQEYDDIFKNDFIGGLITTHKARFYEYLLQNKCSMSPQAHLLQEVSCLKFVDDKPFGDALDSIATAEIIEDFMNTANWQSGNREIVVIGGGGAGMALINGLSKFSDQIQIIHILESNIPRFQKIKSEILPKLHFSNAKIAVYNSSSADDTLLKCKEGAFIINASGVGKDYNGQIISSRNVIPYNSLVWDFNYRGNLHLLAEASSVRDDRNLIVKDGWDYFISGWVHHMCQVLNVSYSKIFHARFSEIANNTRYLNAN